MADYPGAIPAKPTIDTDDMSAATAHSVDRGLLWDELRAALIELGLSPSGSYSTVKARLDDIGDAVSWGSPISSGLSVGSGAVDANYVKIGQSVKANFRLVLAADSTVTGALVFALPANALVVDSVAVSGQLVDASGPATFKPMLSSSTSTTVAVGYELASSTNVQLASISATAPMTWASLDEINLQFEYISV